MLCPRSGGRKGQGCPHRSQERPQNSPGTSLDPSKALLAPGPGQSRQSAPNHPKMPFPKSSFRELGFSFLGPSVPQTDPILPPSRPGPGTFPHFSSEPSRFDGKTRSSQEISPPSQPSSSVHPGSSRRDGMGWIPEGWDGGSWESCSSRSHLSILLSPFSKPFSPQP